jgi:hypothetical protein
VLNQWLPEDALTEETRQNLCLSSKAYLEHASRLSSLVQKTFGIVNCSVFLLGVSSDLVGKLPGNRDIDSNLCELGGLPPVLSGAGVPTTTENGWDLQILPKVRKSITSTVGDITRI